MAEYTYADVIIDPEDPRVEIGKTYYFGDTPSECIASANSDRFDESAILVDIDKNEERPFAYTLNPESDAIWYVCLISKKESEKKYVPFDLSKEEDRAKLRGAWVRIKGSRRLEQQIVALAINTQLVFLPDVVSVETKELLEGYEFLDGTPCGKLVEDEQITGK